MRRGVRELSDSENGSDGTDSSDEDSDDDSEGDLSLNASSEAANVGSDVDSDETMATRWPADEEISQSEFVGVIKNVLRRGAPYPGDRPGMPRWADRFFVCQCEDDNLIYRILDHERDTCVHVHVSRLRSSSFNLGLWYAAQVAERAGVAPMYSALAKWQVGRIPEETMIGRQFERLIEKHLSMGGWYPGDHHHPGDRSETEHYVCSTERRDGGPRLRRSCLVGCSPRVQALPHHTAPITRGGQRKQSVATQPRRNPRWRSKGRAGLEPDNANR